MVGGAAHLALDVVSDHAASYDGCAAGQLQGDELITPEAGIGCHESFGRRDSVSRLMRTSLCTSHKLYEPILGSRCQHGLSHVQTWAMKGSDSTVWMLCC